MFLTVEQHHVGGVWRPRGIKCRLVHLDIRKSGTKSGDGGTDLERGPHLEVKRVFEPILAGEPWRLPWDVRTCGGGVVLVATLFGFSASGQMYPPANFSNGTTHAASYGFVEMICEAGTPCEQDVYVPVCPKDVPCKTAEAFINAWYMKNVDPDHNSFSRVHVYAKKTAFDPVTGIATVKFGARFDTEHNGLIEVGINWVVMGDSDEFKLTPAATACTGTTAGTCSGNAMVMNATPAGFTSGGFLIKEFDIATSGGGGYPHVGPRQLVVDTHASISFPPNQLLITNCGLVGLNTASSNVDMACSVEAVAVAYKNPGVQFQIGTWSLPGSSAQVHHWEYLNSPGFGTPHGMAPGLSRFEVGVGASGPIHGMGADCGYVEVPPVCYPNRPCNVFDTMHQWTGGMLRGTVQGQFDPMNVLVHCGRLWLK